MDEIVIRSMQKWPDVPDVYGWLQLDRRGTWRLRDEAAAGSGQFGAIGNAAFREFIARNYSSDERGRWFFQNGPQRVFVTLAYAPFVFRWSGDKLVDHCNRATTGLEAAWLDEEGSLILKSGDRIGLLDDRDLGTVAEQVAGGTLRFETRSSAVAVGRLEGTEVEGLFGFQRDPKP